MRSTKFAAAAVLIALAAPATVTAQTAMPQMEDTPPTHEVAGPNSDGEQTFKNGSGKTGTVDGTSATTPAKPPVTPPPSTPQPPVGPKPPAPKPDAGKPADGTKADPGTRTVNKGKTLRNGRKCSTRKGRRTCTVYVKGRATKVCVTTKRTTRCHKPKPRKARASQTKTSGFRAPLAAVGKFFINGQNGWTGHCSGTMITRGYVLTAAHCLYNNGPSVQRNASKRPGYQLPHSAMTFSPGSSYYEGMEGGDVASLYDPYGTHRVVNSWVPKCYAEGDGKCDYGIVEVAPMSDGSYVGDHTGTFPVASNLRIGVGASFYQMGYPASGAFQTYEHHYGNAPAFCDDTYEHASEWRTSANSPGAEWLIGSGYYLSMRGCTMNGGASGGPVFTRLSNGAWHVVGVNNIGTGDPKAFGTSMAWAYWDRSFDAFFCQVAPSLCS